MGKLTASGYDNHTVNHSPYFKDPHTGTCTNTWMLTGVLRNAFKAMAGTTHDMLLSYLDQHGQISKPALLNLQHHIADRFLGLERYQKDTRYPIPNSIGFDDTDSRYRYPIPEMTSLD